MPALFVGHGNPINAIEDNDFTRAWVAQAAALPRPRGILCVSAHWETEGTAVTAMTNPRTIHDFYGFPPMLYEVRYAAPGSADLASAVRRLAGGIEVGMDQDWGLDHGTWSVLCRMYPKADIPVVQLSLDRARDMSFHYNLGSRLAPLRDQGYLVIGSGNIVHNLRLVDFSVKGGFDWAAEFDSKAAEMIIEGNHEALLRYDQLGRAAHLSINSAEHYKPLLYILGMKQHEEPISFFAEGLVAGSLSMRGVRAG
jgi:4,5-DOPA dioxygenase extradiol